MGYAVTDSLLDELRGNVAEKLMNAVSIRREF